jgi:hypothetical protein
VSMTSIENPQTSEVSEHLSQSTCLTGKTTSRPIILLEQTSEVSLIIAVKATIDKLNERKIRFAPHLVMCYNTEQPNLKAVAEAVPNI